MIVLYNCASLANICVPGDPSSILINKDKQVPIIYYWTLSYYIKLIL